MMWFASIVLFDNVFFISAVSMETVKQIWDSVRKALFVVGGGLIIFASARNTITW